MGALDGAVLEIAPEDDVLEVFGLEVALEWVVLENVALVEAGFGKKVGLEEIGAEEPEPVAEAGLDARETAGHIEAGSVVSSTAQEVRRLLEMEGADLAEKVRQVVLEEAALV